jgi:hypothetical protein
LAHAEELLSGHNQKELVAALLARLEPKQRVHPKDVKSKGKGKDQSRGGSFGGGSYGGSSKNGERSPRQYGGGKGSRGDGVRFFVNYGLNQGATAGRLLAALCRRGEVTGDKIGSIAIHPNASTFDVSSEVAEKFEMYAGRRDARDPQSMIRRDRGPGQPGNNGYSGGGKKSYGDKSKSGYGGGGKKSYGDNSYGDKSKSGYGGGGKKSYGDKSYGDKGKSSYGSGGKKDYFAEGKKSSAPAAVKKSAPAAKKTQGMKRPKLGSSILRRK